MTVPPSSEPHDDIEALAELMSGPVNNVLSRLEGDEFTTTDFIDVLLTDPPAAAAYDEAVRRRREGERAAKMVVHGQVIPLLLRQSPLVEWAGYAHGVDDAYAVPAWWRLVRH